MLVSLSLVAHLRSLRAPLCFLQVALQLGNMFTSAQQQRDARVHNHRTRPEWPLAWAASARSPPAGWLHPAWPGLACCRSRPPRQWCHDWCSQELLLDMCCARCWCRAQEAGRAAVAACRIRRAVRTRAPATALRADSARSGRRCSVAGVLHLASRLPVARAFAGTSARPPGRGPTLRWAAARVRRSRVSGACVADSALLNANVTLHSTATIVRCTASITAGCHTRVHQGCMVDVGSRDRSMCQTTEHSSRWQIGSTYLLDTPGFFKLRSFHSDIVEAG